MTLGIAAVSQHPLPAGVPPAIPASALYLVINAGFAIPRTRRALRSIHDARDFAPGLAVRIEEPGSFLRVAWPIVAIFSGWAYFDGLAIPGRYLLASFLPYFAQLAITARAVALRERSGVELYLWLGGGATVTAHPSALALNAY